METTEPSEPSKRRRIRELEVMVADTIADTHDTTTLVLFTGNDRLEYLPGHFCTIDPHNFPQLQRFTAFLEDQKGKKEPPRAYSLASAPHEKYLAITVKEEKYVSGTTKYPPLLSPLLVHRLPRGTRLMITGFTGPYVLPPDINTRTDHLVHVCAGSGIVPNYSIIKHCLVELPKMKHTLVYSNKTHDDIIFRRELDTLARANPDKLQIVYTLTRDAAASSQGTNFRSGRLNQALLKEFIPDPSAVEVFCCGPGITKFDREAAKAKGEEVAPRFLESSLSALQAIGITSKQIHRESYG
ncbi:3-ketosteroid-9-alpha-hydroxylase reductase subunit [Anatilimnocola aggregata]|uniref:3-ketosteroid-9-alpha-hydroxylase reductase subunit n=1 Tax=Anatilimnocola aggregata TaxID=2528021 RepID=A0A517Y8B1_9BACT|nr:oxidoreductase [Anatilimnocola aggregata]QDU26435.1 3-ketosteroid-9-alpha-hydroxylase reductase subunit [Anatilimnocola aggregata]